MFLTSHFHWMHLIPFKEHFPNRDNKLKMWTWFIVGTRLRNTKRWPWLQSKWVREHDVHIQDLWLHSGEEFHVLSFVTHCHLEPHIPVVHLPNFSAPFSTWIPVNSQSTEKKPQESLKNFVSNHTELCYLFCNIPYVKQALKLSYHFKRNRKIKNASIKWQYKDTKMFPVGLA